MTDKDTAALLARVAALEKFVSEVRDVVPDLFGAGNDLISVEVLEAFQSDALDLIGPAAR